MNLDTTGAFVIPLELWVNQDRSSSVPSLSIKQPAAGQYYPLGTISTVPRAYDVFRAYEGM
jgi:hypothetical protein